VTGELWLGPGVISVASARGLAIQGETFRRADDGARHTGGRDAVMPVTDPPIQPTGASFEEVVLPHLDAAYSLARWIVRDRSSAEDAVQEAMLNALTYFHTYRGRNARAWVLQIVRNAAYRHLRDSRNRPPESSEGGVITEAPIGDPGGPEQALINERTKADLAAALGRLPAELRECLVLRELEDLSYRDIAAIIDVPIGTVMSRLWRARRSLVQLVSGEDL